MTDDWVKEIDKKIVGAVLLDFSAAFDIIDQNQLLKKHTLLIKSLEHLLIQGFFFSFTIFYIVE